MTLPSSVQQLILSFGQSSNRLCLSCLVFLGWAVLKGQAEVVRNKVFLLPQSMLAFVAETCKLWLSDRCRAIYLTYSTMHDYGPGCTDGSPDSLTDGS